jgi:diguanylate cyclase (GGDEF)-like protein
LGVAKDGLVSKGISVWRQLGQIQPIGVPIVTWLILAFTLVIGAFVVATGYALRSTGLVTSDLARMQDEFEPLSSSVRELGDGLAAYDRAVLSYLRYDSPDNRAASLAAAERLSAALTRSVDGGERTQGPRAADLLHRIAEHQAEGFRLLGMQDERKRAIEELERAYASLDRRIKSAGGEGVIVGNAVLASPSMTEVARAIEAARKDVARELTWGGDFAAGPEGGETQLRRAFARRNAEFSAAPGRPWLAMQLEDLRAAVRSRRLAIGLGSQIELRQTAYAANGAALSMQIREYIEAPAWHAFREAAAGAQQAVARVQASIRSATLNAVLFALIALIVTAYTVTWPVRRLTSSTRRLAGGDLTTRVPRGGASEIDELAQAFNHMAAELAQAEQSVRAYQSQLEQRVEQRTQQLQYLAEHDPLTNLPNRRQLFQRLNAMLETAEAGGTPRSHVAVLFLDLDNFKAINDTLGHEFGDRLLMGIGDRLRGLVDGHGTIARLGGDEFTVVFSYSGDPTEVVGRAETLVASFQRPLQIDRREVAVGASCGVALYPEHGRDAATLLRAADAALFRAKEHGRNRLCVHDPSMLVQASNRFRVEQALRKAIEGGEFVLYYQPVVCLGRQRAIGVEALLRWRRDDDRVVSAGDFIEIAEQSGLMIDLNEWILETAAEACARWRRTGWPDARVAVNVSAQQFVTGNFLLELDALLQRHELPPDAIELELTETMLQTGAVTVDALNALRVMGVQTALDDFGTGYSSLTSLEQLPLSRVKLDRSVINGIDTSPRSAAIVHSIIGLSRNLGLQVTIEGVERPAQLDFLAACGEVSVQGFLVAAPSEESVVIGLVQDMRNRLDDLLGQAERQRPASQEDELASSVRMLRRGRRRRERPVSA